MRVLRNNLIWAHKKLFMAEDEIRKHAKAAYKAWNNPHTSWKHKLKEVLLEIAIIVFAVSISIWLHNWSEHSKDRKEEKEFLIGLKKDLVSDTTEMASDRATYKALYNAYRYLREVGTGNKPTNNDSLNNYIGYFFNSTLLIPNISRFEGLKGSGKLDIIENKELLNLILDLYQENIPSLQLFNQSFSEFKRNNLSTYVDAHAILNNNDSIINLPEMLRQPQMRMLLSRGDEVRQNIAYYTICIEKCRDIIKEIDDEVK